MERHEAPGQQQKIFEIQSPEKVLKKFARRWQLVSAVSIQKQTDVSLRLEMFRQSH
jgi:hypothetical protein